MRYPITFWYGIRPEFLSKERIIEAMDAGFNIIECKYDKETNFKVLKWCEELGLGAFVFDDRMWGAMNDSEGWRDNLKAMIAEYSAYPALKCWFLRDEPVDAQFSELARVTEFMKENDPGHPIYINLLPLIAVWPHENYQKHIDNYLNTVKPAILSYDHYNLMKREVEELGDLPEADVSPECRARNHWEDKIFEAWDREGFYDNLEMIKKSADNFGIPWMNIILLVEHWHYRRPSESEIRWEAFTTLAYGSEMLSYFTYWTPGVGHNEPWSYHHGIIESDGTRDEKYGIVKQINKELQLLFTELDGRKPVAIMHTSEKTDITVKLFTPTELVTELSADAVVYSEYKDGMFMLVNKNHRATQEVKFKATGKAQVFCKQCGKWIDLPCDGGYFKYTLEPGDGMLFRIL